MSATARGIGAMVLGSALLSTNDAISKWLARDLPITQVWCLRSLSAMALILAAAWIARERAPLAVVRPAMQALRAALFVATTLCIVAGLSLMPLVDLSAIVFSSPLLVAVLSPALIGERARGYRVAGAAAGFLGVLVILKPGSGVFQLASLLALAAAVLSALRDIVTRAIGRYESPLAILACSYAAVLVIGFGLALTPWVDWQPVSALGWALLAANGAVNVAAHFLVVEALRLGEVTAVVPFRYAGLLWALVLGFVLFAHLPDPATVAGAAMVVASGLYILRREREEAKGGGE